MKMLFQNFTLLFSIFYIQTSFAQLGIDVTGLQNSNCSFPCDGMASVNAYNGTSPYTYAISAPGTIDPNFGYSLGLCAGTYTITATDANLATVTTTIVITAPPPIIPYVSVTNNGFCYGSGTANIDSVIGVLLHTITI